MSPHSVLKQPSRLRVWLTDGAFVWHTEALGSISTGAWAQHRLHSPEGHQAWSHVPMTPAPGRQIQKDSHKFQASWDHIHSEILSQNTFLKTIPQKGSREGLEVPWVPSAKMTRFNS